MNIRCSVVIPAYQETPFLKQVIDSIKNQTIKPFEIIIAHSSTCDPSFWLDDPSNNVHVIHSDQQWFPGAARNAGAKIAKGEWLIFLDSDVITGKNWLSGFVDSYSRNQKSTVFIGSLEHGEKDGYWGRCLWFIEFGSVHAYRKSHLMKSAPGANFMISKNAFDSVVGFDENMLIGEDAFFFIHLREKGHKLQFTPKAKAYHQCKSAFPFFIHRLFNLGKGGAFVRKKYVLPGSKATKFPPIALILWAPRIFQIFKRVFESKGPVIKLVIHMPGIAIGLLSWSLGFFSESTTD